MFSSDGFYTNYLLSPNNCVEREYKAIVAGKVDFQDLQDRLLKGIKTSDGVFGGSLTFAKILPASDVVHYYMNCYTS